MHLFSYLENPHNISFEGQDNDEKILLVLRAHPITNLGWIFFAILVFSVPFLVPQLIVLTGITLPNIAEEILLGFLIINYLLVLVIVFEGFLYWYFNVSILTNKRIIDIDFESLLYKKVDLAPLSNVEEANSHVKGIIGTVFNFGDVLIQTAGASVGIDLKNVPDPHKVADRVMDEAHLSKKGGHHAP
ncbi:PH domain-containing protein [Candidatus Daviesbacteria bacterium]|nr:PH domain-containing protein [Candidatus Daviesbacteria bacterium]